MKVGLVQGSVLPSESNWERTLRGIDAAAKNGAGIVCLQELFNSPYFCASQDKRFFSLAESIPGPTTDALGGAARKNGVVLVGGSVFEKADGKFFNTSVVFGSDGRIIGTYRKTHIPNDSHYWEKFYFSPGDSGYRVFDTEKGRIGVLICYDQWFPEAARAAALKGAQIIFYPTAIGWTKEMRASEPYAAANWVDVQRAHAISNHVFVAAVNRVGNEGDIDFWGQSFVADPFGKVIAKAGGKEGVVVADCDFAEIERARQWMFMENRRPETYREIVK